MSTVSQSVSLSLEGRNRWAARVVSAAGAVPLLLTALWLATANLSVIDSVATLILLVMLYVTVAPVLYCVPLLVEWATRRRLAGALACEVDENGLSLRRADGRTLRLARGALALAWTPSPNVVELLTRDGAEGRVAFASSLDAAWLIRQLRRASIHARAYVIPSERPAQRVARRVFGTLVPLAIGVLAVPYGWASALFGMGAAAITSWAVIHGAPGVEFGADGLLVRGRFRQGYIRYREIVGTRLVRGFGVLPHRVELALEGGRRVRLPGWLHASRARLLKALVDEGREMSVSGFRAGAQVAQLARGQEDDDQWVARVSNAGQQGGYRGAALGVSRLDSLMRNPAADPEQRVAAALALRVEPEGKRRIRAAAEASTEPEVKDVLEVLASEEASVSVERLDRALRRIARHR